MTPEDEEHAALLACIEMLRTGTTTFCEAGTLFDVGTVARAVAADRHARDAGPVDVGPGGRPGRMRQTHRRGARR